MQCPQCRSNVTDSVGFCPRCGAQLDAAPPRHAGEKHGDPAADTLSAQVTRAQASSRRRLPVLLIVILVTLALAATAFAATMVYQRVILPVIEERAQPEAAPEGDAGQEAEPDAGADAEAGSDAEADAEPDAEADAEPDAAADAEAAQRAVYDNLLATYRDSQGRGWADASSSALDDLASLGIIVDLREDTNVGVTYDELMAGTVSYAYTDLGGDGTLDLVIGVVSGSGDGSKLIGAFSTNGSETVSLMNGDLTSRSYWYVTDDGLLLNRGSNGAASNSASLYTVSGGYLTLVTTYTREGAEFQRYDASTGTFTPITGEEFNEASNSMGGGGLAWVPLADFEPAEPTDASAPS